MFFNIIIPSTSIFEVFDRTLAIVYLTLVSYLETRMLFLVSVCIYCNWIDCLKKLETEKLAKTHERKVAVKITIVSVWRFSYFKHSSFLIAIMLTSGVTCLTSLISKPETCSKYKPINNYRIVVIYNRA